MQRYAFSAPDFPSLRLLRDGTLRDSTLRRIFQLAGAISTLSPFVRVQRCFSGLCRNKTWANERRTLEASPSKTSSSLLSTCSALMAPGSKLPWALSTSKSQYSTPGLCSGLRLHTGPQPADIFGGQNDCNFVLHYFG